MLFLLTIIATALAVPAENKWSRFRFTSLVSFGDDFTDDSRWSYYVSHNYTVPPVGWVNPVNYHAFDGGRPWVDYVKQYTGCNLYNYAISNAVCSSYLTPVTNNVPERTLPDIEAYQLPTYVAESKKKIPGKPFLNVPQASTVYAIWIGSVEWGEFVRGNPWNRSVDDAINCIFNQVKRLYDTGARHFVVFNVLPFDKTPVYAGPPNDVGPTWYWSTKSEDHQNVTDITISIDEYGNQLYAAKRLDLPGAEVAIFDIHGLVEDMYENPSKYLNGTAPANSTGVMASSENGSM
ncbi:carbohydrate esterase family 16 protein [Piedraia hortae CBS 480.64]|uniref:Carbohydrate esterase family 16 protein n=1 Tax=Piedraia hortae CBS 480.64 TaxID=1314780 RepID=A0A6A7C0N0_9PEZI|nr:carbohydrate esterase family 16 protein [Piedraia hortae CBS 480.64]